MAQAADLAGYVQCTGQLLMVAFEVLDDATNMLPNMLAMPGNIRRSSTAADSSPC